MATKQKMALLIAAHNEELVLEKTITSAIHAGMKPENIYVVDDYSSDSTSRIAKSLLPKSNVSRVHRSGKGLAISKAIKRFEFAERYYWLHIADADGGFAPNYFRVLRRNIRKNYIAATGYVRSLPGRDVSQYRVFEYTIGMELHRRLQSMFGVISVIPGPTSCFRTDILKSLKFNTGSLTEDFDVTLQIHRQKLGKIQYIPNAYVYTQDPRTVKDFYKQVTRWNRGVMQGLVRHKIGRKKQKIDAYLSMQIFQSLLLFGNFFIWVPYYSVTARFGGAEFLAATFVFDVLLTFATTLFTSLRSSRYDIVSAFPYIYLIRWLNVFIFMKAFLDVIILRRFRISDGQWSTLSRRYSNSH